MTLSVTRLAAVIVAVAMPAFGAVVTPGSGEGSMTDLFNGATVLSSSSVLTGFSAADAFGAVTPSGPYAESMQGGHVIFNQNGVDTITFKTAAPVTISGFSIYAGSDGAGNAFRGFSGVSLYGSVDGTSYSLLDSATYRPELGSVIITGRFAAVTDQYFRFEGIDTNGGARLVEIDAIVPEPASLALVAAGLGIAGLLRRRKAGRA